MASVEVVVAARTYKVACRDGGEDQLRAVAEIVDKRARDAADALGAVSEARLLLYAALLLADDVGELQAVVAEAGATSAPRSDAGVGEALEALAERAEALAERLENQLASPLEEHGSTS